MLGQRGWSPDPTAPATEGFVRLRGPVSDRDVAPWVELEPFEDRAGPLIDVQLGLSADPAYRLQAVLGTIGLDGDPVDDERLPAETVPDWIADRLELHVGADLEDVRRETTTGHPDGDPTPLLADALHLAAAGRSEEARSALDRVDTGDPPSRRFAHRLGRWLDQGMPTPPVPSGPPPTVPVPEPRSFAEVRRRDKARRRAIEQVANSTDGAGRDGVRAHLDRALREQGAPPDSAISFELMVDRLLAPPSGRSRRRALADLTRVIRDHRLPGGAGPRPLPERLRPPLRACSSLVSGTGDVGVRLEPDAADRLEDAVEWLPSPTVGAAFRAEGWLEPDGAAVAVHLGDRRIGTITSPDAERYAPAIEAARLIDEAVCLSLTLLAPTAGRGWVVGAGRPALPEPVDEHLGEPFPGRPSAADVRAVLRSYFPGRRQR